MAPGHTSSVGGIDDSRPVSDFSSAELREYACEHVYYEIDMFVRSVGAATIAREPWPMNVAVEAFTTHLRNLLDFVYPPGNRRPTDVLALDFFTDADAWAPPPKSAILRNAHMRAHKEVAHLTTGRKSDPAEKGWDMPAISRELAPLLSAFSQTAEFVCETFPTDVASRISELPLDR